MTNILTIVGARPQFIKAAMVSRAIVEHNANVSADQPSTVHGSRHEERSTPHGPRRTKNEERRTKNEEQHTAHGSQLTPNPPNAMIPQSRQVAKDVKKEYKEPLITLIDANNINRRSNAPRILTNSH